MRMRKIPTPTATRNAPKIQSCLSPGTPTTQMDASGHLETPAQPETLWMSCGLEPPCPNPNPFAQPPPCKGGMPTMLVLISMLGAIPTMLGTRGVD
mmetsp:Transcript_123859/g.214725  ORF Transcript_123859/g.214725 Transcript_123859/m.214725 type:complete len:96 (-) Transcript_123859:44-331(-)